MDHFFRSIFFTISIIIFSCFIYDLYADEIFITEINPVVEPGSYNRLHRGHHGLVATDDGRLLIMYIGFRKTPWQSGLFARASKDFGNNWEDLQGKENATFIGGGNNTPNHHAFGGDRNGNGYVFYVKKCNGGGKPLDLYFQKIYYKDACWEIGEARLVADDPYKCTKGMSIFPEDDKIWAAWSHTDSNKNLFISVKYSDDDGSTWKIAGNKRAVSNIKYDHGYEMGIWYWPSLTFYNRNIACVWRGYNDLNWVSFDDTLWTESQPIRDECDTEFHISAVESQNNNLFVSSTRNGLIKVLIWDGINWTLHMIDEGVRGNLVGPRLAINDNILFCFWAKDNVLFYKKYFIESKKWTDTHAISIEDNSITGIATPQISPSNYAAAVWSDGENLKFVKIVNSGTNIYDSKEEYSNYQNDLIFQLNNYPNPFNSCTVIPYHINNKKQQVSLSIFNVNGQLICKLVDEYKEPGQYQEVWNGKDMNGRDMSSGVYVCSLIIGSQMMNNKILLLR